MAERVPEMIYKAILREQESWGDGVPMFAELPGPSRQILFQEWSDLTVGDCEQLVEHHTRRAISALKRFALHESRHTAKTAAWHILRARLYRCRYCNLIGDDSDLAQLPFEIREASDDE